MSRNPYIRKIPNTWWLKNSFYKAYMAREISCIFITIYSVVLLVGFYRLYQGPEAYQGWLEALQSPWSIALAVVTLLSTMYHSISWFKLAPQAMPLQFGKIRVIPGLVIALHYLAFLAILAVVFFVISL